MKHTMDNAHVGRYSGEDYVKAGEESIGGFFDRENDFISINEGSNIVDRVEGHESRHLLDKYFPLSDEEKTVLNGAYDNDFLEIPNTEYRGTIKEGYNMEPERVTTNRDARDLLLGGDKYRLAPRSI
jgi:hypothetical protein